MKNKLLRAFLIAVGVWLVCVGAAAVSIKLSKPAYAEQLEKYYAPYSGESRVLHMPWYCRPIFYTYSLDGTGKAAEKKAYAQVAGAMLADCEYVINAEEVKSRSGAMLEEYSAAAELLGISLEEYLNSSGVLFTGGQISGDCMYYIQEQAMIDIQTEAVTKYLAEKWNIRADEKDVSELASSEGITPETAEYRLVEEAVTEKVLKLARKK